MAGKKRKFSPSIPPSSPPIREFLLPFSPQLPARRLFLTPTIQPVFQSTPPTLPLATSEGTEAVLLGACNVIENIPDDRRECEEQQEFLAQIG